MTKLIVDQAMREQLANVAQPLELCDESGRTLGFFNPVFDPAEYEGEECPIGIEELKRRSRAGGGRPLADILADLERTA